MDKSFMFPERLCFEVVGYRNDTMLVELMAPFTFRSSLGTIVIPQGFITDFASVPRFLWNTFAPTGDYAPAAVVHDYLYSSSNTWFTRKQADDLFLEAMHNLGLGWAKRGTIYRAVRVFGGHTFKGTKS